MTDARLRGQEVAIKVVQGVDVLTELNSIATWNNEIALEISEDGFLGEPTNRFDSILNGYGGDFEFQVNTADYTNFESLVERKAQRASIADAALQFNVVRIDRFANGGSVVTTYLDVAWGPITDGIGSRKDFVKKKASFKCSKRSLLVNQA